MNINRGSVGVAIVAAAMLVSAVASAGQVRFEFSDWYGDSGSPSGSGPWMVATFEDAGANRVILTLEAFLTGNEHIKQVNFNLDPAFDAADLQINQLSGGPQAKKSKALTNAFDAGSSFRYDTELRWKRPGDRFEDNDVVQFELLGINGLTAQSFLFMNQATKGPLAYAAAHVGGIGCGDDSSWITPTVVPLPAPMLLIGCGLLVVPLVRRRWMQG